MKKKQQELIAYSKSQGVNLTIDPSLNKKYIGKGTTSNKLEKANEIISNLKFIHK
ncbi:hypothetical protein SAMN05421788_108251 [Filimonas lacunae]|uniref:Uncharacterized protein n=1 Tax=Filimonas lacunae TaxID=477680 RepID=A0A1N7R292_9BACT|nr:hypothetical protein [Filimonas lacunae]SIT29223.1 hypothetical protein SAMN05421788_108251 [Filimonas lacunae]